MRERERKKRNNIDAVRGLWRSSTWFSGNVGCCLAFQVQTTTQLLFFPYIFSPFDIEAVYDCGTGQRFSKVKFSNWPFFSNEICCRSPKYKTSESKSLLKQRVKCMPVPLPLLCHCSSLSVHAQWKSKAEESLVHTWWSGS